VNPHDRRIRKMCTGFKNPLELHRSVGIAIRELPKTRKKLRRSMCRSGRKARPLDLAESRSS
jgi:hypothetical protein